MQDNGSSEHLDTGVERIFALQALFIVITACVFFYQQSWFGVQSALFGGGIALINTGITHWRLQVAIQIAKTAPGQEVYSFYIGAVMRFVVTLILFAVGMGVLKLEPIAVLSAFAAAQASFLFAGWAKPPSLEL